jgi:hypothetical protein
MICETTVNDCYVIQLGKIHDRSGNITVVEENGMIPFSVKRVYYLYDVPGGVERGGHAHLNLFQLIIAASGSFNVKLNDGIASRIFNLNRPDEGLLLTPCIWRKLNGFSSGAICLVLASEKYIESDCIRVYNEFLKIKTQ